MTSDYDDILRYIFSVRDCHGDEVYGAEVEEIRCAPITELMICIRDLLREEPEAFPVKVYRTDVLNGDIWSDGEFVAAVASRRQALDLLRSARPPRTVQRQAFFDIVRQRNQKKETSLSVTRQAVADLKRRVEEFAKAIPSGQSQATARVVAERVADGRPRFLPRPEGFADLAGSRLEFESRLRKASELWFGPIHHEGIVWWCQGFKPIGPWKLNALVPGGKGVAVTRDHVQVAPLPLPVSLACFGFTYLRKHVVFQEQVMTAARLSEKLVLSLTSADVERQNLEHSRLLNKLKTLRAKRDAAVGKLIELERGNLWDEGLDGERPYHVFLSGRKRNEVQRESVVAEVLAEPLVEETYVHPALELQNLTLPISKEWVDCDETDLFFKWRNGRHFLLVSMRIDPRSGSPMQDNLAYTVHEVSILNGIRRGVEPLLQFVAPPERSRPRAGVDFDRFCVLVVRYIAQRSRGYLWDRYIQRISEIKALHAKLWNERTAKGPGQEAKKISARAAEGRPTPLELPWMLISPVRGNIAFRTFTTEADSVICDPVFWEGAIWIIRASKPTGVPIKKTNLTVSPTVIRVDASGYEVVKPPGELARYLLESGLISRRALDPGQQNSIVAWTVGEYSRIIERVGLAAGNGTIEIDRKLAATAKRIARLEAETKPLEPARSLRAFFFDRLKDWDAFFLDY